MTKDELLELIDQYSNPAVRTANKGIIKPFARRIKEYCKKYDVEVPYWLEDVGE